MLAVGEDRQLVLAEVELFADQPWFVGVDDGAVLGPDLDPHELALEHEVTHGSVDPIEGVAVHGHQIVVEQRRDDPGRADERNTLRLVDRLLRPDPPAGVGREDRHEHERHEPGEREPEDEPADRDRLDQYPSSPSIFASIIASIAQTGAPLLPMPDSLAASARP